MGVSLNSQAKQAKTENIVEGFGVVVYDEKYKCWFGPGSQPIHSRDAALKEAKRLDRKIRLGMAVKNTDLLN